MKVTEISVRRPVLVSVVFLALSLMGIVSFTRLPLDLFPEIEPPVMSVITAYPGASAKDVEQKVSEVIEESLGALGDLKEITSTSKENISVVTLEFEFGANLDEAANEIRQNLEFAKGQLPSGIDPPILFQFDTSKFPVLMFGVVSERGNIQEDRQLVEDRVLDPLKRIPGVGSVQIFNAPEEQLHVEIERERLTAYNLTIDQIARAIGAENFSIPAGHLDVGPHEFAVRMPAEFESPEEMSTMVLTRHNGGVVRLGDVARIRGGLEEVREVARVEGQRAIVGGILKRSGGNTVEISDRAQKKIAELQDTLPSHIKIIPVVDTSKFIRLMIGNLSSTLLVAGLLVVVVVFVFLRRVRSSFIVGLAIPASMILVFVLMYQADQTLNAISMMAMALAIGMVVDNAIVVLENITRHVEGGMDPEEAAVLGAREVGPALLGSTLTTVSVFAPLIFIAGLVGVMFGQLAFVISSTVTASLFVALTLTPAACGRLLRSTRAGKEGAIYRALERVFVGLERGYRALLSIALRWRWTILGGAVLLVASTFLLLSSVGTDFMPEQNAGEIRVTAELPIGAGLEETARIGDALAAELDRQPDVQRIFYRAGTSKVAFGTATGQKEGSNIVQITAMLVPYGERDRSDAEVADHIRRFARSLPEVTSLTVQTGSGASGLLMGRGKPLTVELLGNDLDDLSEAAAEVERVLRQVDGTVDISADLIETTPEIRYTLDRERASRLGVPAASVGIALRTALYGETVGKYRGGSEDIDIYLRLRESDRAKVDDLQRIEVSSLTGQTVRLGDLGRFVEADSPIEIRRKDKQRMLTVGAAVRDRPLGDVVVDAERLLAEASVPPSVAVHFGGQVEQQNESFEGILLALVLGAILVYLVMAGVFESFLDPFVVALAIPFSVTGAFLFLLMTGTTLSLPSFLGLVILLGIVVNNGIVLVDYVNLLRREHGYSLTDALEVGGARRLRPVLMTTLTTCGGMLPLALASGEGSELWRPMGLATLGGLLFSTFVTLVLVPVLYSLLDRFRRGTKGVRAVREVETPALKATNETQAAG